MKYSELIRAKLLNKFMGKLMLELLDGCDKDTFDNSRLATCGKFADRVHKCIDKCNRSIEHGDKYFSWMRPIYDLLYCGDRLRFIANGEAHIKDPLVTALDDEFSFYDGFCKSPICPICSKLKSERLYARMRFNLENYIKWSEYPEGVSFIFFTFSPPLYRKNENFGNYFQAMRSAINKIDRFYGSDTKNNVCIGVFGNGEYTFSGAAGYESWSHPHFHVIFAFDNRFFKNPQINRSGRLTYFDVKRNDVWEHSCTKFINSFFQKSVIEKLSDDDKKNIPDLMKEWRYKAEYLGADLINRLPEICKYSTKFISIQNDDQLLTALKSIYGRHCRISTGIFKLTKDLEYAFKNYLNDVGEHYVKYDELTADQIDLIENSSYELNRNDLRYIWIGYFDNENNNYILNILDSVRKKE